METMGTDGRAPTLTLIDRLLAQPQAFGLYQTLSLLERVQSQAKPLGHGCGADEAIRLRGVSSLRFASSDVSEVRRRSLSGDQAVGLAQSMFTVSTPVMSLGGANGPLPLFVTEMMLAAHAAKDDALVDFLDIFNHRFLSFLYRSRKKVAIGLHAQPRRSAVLAVCLDAIGHLRANDDTAIADAAITHTRGTLWWLRHVGLRCGVPRSMVGLEAVLAERLAVKVHGRQCVGGWQRVDAAETMRLSGGTAGRSAPRLGRGILGQRVWDQGSGLSLTFPALSSEDFVALLPEGPKHTLASRLIEEYASQAFDVQFELHHAGPADGCRLGSAAPPRLGWTSRLAVSRPAAAAVLERSPLTSDTAARSTVSSATAAQSAALAALAAGAPTRSPSLDAVSAAGAAGRAVSAVRVFARSASPSFH